MLLIIAAVLAAGAIVAGPIMSDVEQMPYTVVGDSNATPQIRDYPALWVAQVRMQGARDEAIGDGFKVLAGYIFGDNVAAQSVAMTAPVTQQNIAMTAPVTQQSADNNTWLVRFGMPAQYKTRDQLPNPKDARVELLQSAPQRFAVLTFSGVADTQNLQQNTQKLQDMLTSAHKVVVGQPVYAFFNPPWTLPFLRRNEVMLPIQAD